MAVYKLSLAVFLTSALLLLLSAGNAQAKPKLWIFGWGSDHWEGQDFRPYLMPPTMPHNRQWDMRFEDRGNGVYTKWTPQEWFEGNNGEKTLQGFYEASVLHDLDMRKDVPVLSVGPNFYLLSGYDKRRLMDFVESYHSLLEQENGRFQIKDDISGELIGYYDQYGLRMR